MRIVLACLIAAVTAVAAGAGSPSSDLALGVDLGGKFWAMMCTVGCWK